MAVFYAKYLMDMFSSVEDSKLSYISHEVQSCTATWCKLNKTIEAEGGHHTVPASIFYGISEDAAQINHRQPSHHEETQEAHYFLMVTYNPNWPEISNHPGMNG